MSEQVLSKLVPKLKKLEEGAYARSYGTGSVQRRTSTHQLVGDLLSSLGIEFEEDARLPGDRDLRADFHVNKTWVFVEPELDEEDMRVLGRKKSCVIIKRESLRSDRFDHGIRVLGLSEESRGQTIFLDDPSFNFDYAHILPKTEKCSVMHGHTSSVLVEMTGRPAEGMVVDFGVAKQIVREAVKGLDHKLFINGKYVTSMDRESVSLKFNTIHGEFAIKAPKDTTVLLDGEATVENLAREVLGRIAPRMPRNVTSVGVYVYEGLNKGSHILAKIHQDGAQSRRKKR
ncbi:MAG: 6-carboxytetrahydropterin synthase [Nitrososphaerota archaeon]|nr:6-carboxytetrahydropterin synthase [Nitrososphaerota archaeon]MDG6942313.1 6-carboxytetrahydropterin synthase [Nitrososphaerota archaeon]MDG6942778.1 6-carboxytetrahydropterin synthase [Nitrososphaerota archaeon]MDG6948565.1 6-carboxytetrahydropterin synthase [Nitrososphaerota archaeon]MDG6950491.1 6-carboxytetrahydropterin synthase [Nitrososphaerota archaeon]